MDRSSHSVATLMQHPSAFVPLAMSAAALAMVLGYVAIYGAVHPAHDGTVGHLWQLLMVGQVPIIAFFAIKWLPQARRNALLVLAEQLGAVLASFAAVFFLNLG